MFLLMETYNTLSAAGTEQTSTLNWFRLQTICAYAHGTAFVAYYAICMTKLCCYPADVIDDSASSCSGNKTTSCVLTLASVLQPL